jgi:hypothetical protein
MYLISVINRGLPKMDTMPVELNLNLYSRRVRLTLSSIIDAIYGTDPRSKANPVNAVMQWQ